MKRLLAALLFVVGFLFSQPSQAQVFVVASCGTVPTSQATLTAGNPGMLFIDNTGKLCTAASVSVTGFTPGGTFATLTATNVSASVALPVGATVAIQNTGTTTVSCTLGVGSATAVASEIIVQAASTVFVTPGSNTFGACIDQTGSTSNLVVLAGGSGLGTGFGGGGGSGGGGAITAAINSYAAGALSAGAFAAGAGVDGWDLTQGAKADALCTVPTSATACSVISLLKALTNVANGPIATGSAIIGRVGIDQTTPGTTDSVTPKATESHLGEIASNQIKIQVAQTVTAASAYASGNAIGGLMTIAGASRLSGAVGTAGTGGILTGMMMNSKSLQTTQVDVVFFDANPTGSTCTDKTAFSLATADFDKVVGYLTVPGTAANGAGWVAGTVGSVGVATYYPMTYDLASSTSLFACAITRGTPTFTATTDVSFKFNALRN